MNKEEIEYMFETLTKQWGDTDNYVNDLLSYSKNLQQENQRLKEELKYTVPIVEHNKIVSKKLKENQELKKQYCERTDCSGRLGNSKKVEQLEKELEQLKEIEKEHQKINGELREEIKELKEKYMKLEDKYIHNVSCCNEEDCDLFCEHQELKLELSGYRQAILEDKDMLGLKEENQSLKKQLEKHYCNRTDCSGRIKDSKKYDSLEQKSKNHQKEFINWLEENYEITQDIWYIKILNKYKEIIGDKE